MEDFCGTICRNDEAIKQPERERDKALVVATREARRENKINQWMDGQEENWVPRQLQFNPNP